ncbi:hypothetical protein FDP41_003469 [Naegleria fowleri]|uniref:Uncharacterized protein n=1 Tax=Naegleria fowleri TaxID=5763 RepID=A0A6A5BKE8_NAEFO|nr:uncharacterized protein FDP41_003469 [Naegleria fowleri]KAF0977477.1 hypothetical protein FDP41_003469 [Naegleria fowleri]
MENVEGLVEPLRIIDAEINKENPSAHSCLEDHFKKQFFAKNKGRIACWNGLQSSMKDKNNIYSRNGHNYMISNCATRIETYLMQAVDKKMPVADDKFTKDLPLDHETIDFGFNDEKMINFKTNLLTHGVAGFMHFGFKYATEKSRIPNEKKRMFLQVTLEIRRKK